MSAAHNELAIRLKWITVAGDMSKLSADKSMYTELASGGYLQILAAKSWKAVLKRRHRQ